MKIRRDIQKCFDLDKNGVFPGGSVVKNLLAIAGDSGSIAGLGRFFGGGNGNPILSYSGLGNPMDRGAWQATLHGIAKVRHDLITKQQKYHVIKTCGKHLKLCSEETYSL